MQGFFSTSSINIPRIRSVILLARRVVVADNSQAKEAKQAELQQLLDSLSPRDRLLVEGLIKDYPLATPEEILAELRAAGM